MTIGTEWPHHSLLFFVHRYVRCLLYVLAGFAGIKLGLANYSTSMAEEQVEKKVSALMVLVAKQEERGVYVHMV